ncbi:uncharacterized protein [Rutidosis leptorrhynchoides]|uniref:uncharacterized protein n=1 Tax=Rutidosis leptorrhynchoides TaxID=125765 RepID=UPI003A99622B
MAEEASKVTLNVYDLSNGLARQLSTTFLGKAIEGIWHTGVVVYGNEYFFSGGIQHTPAGRTPYGTPIKAVDLGFTYVPKDVFEMFLQEISPRYTAESYSLLTHNCNNFSNEVANFLVSKGIPEYILQLPTEVMSSPMGAVILPMLQNLETTLKAGAVPQAPQFIPTSASRPSQPLSSASRSIPSLAQAKEKETKSEEAKKSDLLPAAKLVEAGREPSSNGTSVVDPLGDARNKVQEEIGREFAAIMASGTLRASEAAALATRKVMQRYGRLEGAAPQS